MPKPKDPQEEKEEIQLESSSSETQSTQTKVKPKKKEPTKEELAEMEEAKLDVVDRFFPGSKPKKKEEPSTEEKAPEKKEEEAKAESKTEGKKEPSKSKKPPKTEPAQPPPPVLDEAERLIKESPVEEPPPKPEEKPKLGPKEQRILDACAHLEKTNPRYKGLRKSMSDFWDKEQEYISKWESENPGKEFKSDDEEHSSFYSTNEPQVDPDDLDDAKAEVRARRITEESNKVNREENKRERIQQKVAQARPKIDSEVFGAISSLIEGSHEEFAKLLKKDPETGVTYMDKDAVAKMEEVDPVGKEVLMQVSEPLSLIVREIELMRVLGEDYNGDPQGGVKMRQNDGWFFPHTEAVQLFHRVEKALKESDPKETMRDGKRFSTIHELRVAQQNIIKSKATDQRKREALNDLNSRYYTIDYDDAIAAAIAEYSERAKVKISRLARKPQKSASETTPDKEKEKQEQPKETKPKKAPAISAASDSVDNGSVNHGKHQVDGKLLEQKMGWA